MKVLLIGAGGQVGRDLQRSLSFAETLVSTTRDGRLADGTQCIAMDVTRLDDVRTVIVEQRPDVVVNAAAYTAVDRAESEPELAFQANGFAPGAMAEACARIGARLVHFSTDYVFDGNATRAYREDDPTAPTGAYGASKLAGERAIAEVGGDHLILRTAWVYSLHGQNFLRTMLRVGAERDELRVVADQFGCPTPSWLIADTTAKLLRDAPAARGVLHLVAGGVTSWHGFAEAIFESAAKSGLIENKPRVTAIATADYPTPARRPAYSALDCRALTQTLGAGLPDWREALAETFCRPAGVR